MERSLQRIISEKIKKFDSKESWNDPALFFEELEVCGKSYFVFAFGEQIFIL